MRRCAVIVEDRPSIDIDRIIQAHMEFLPGWDLEHISNVEIRGADDYNKLLTDQKFWAYFDKKGYQKILVFQHDSEILRVGIDDFLNYSFVGSPWRVELPWARQDRAGGNGGISIRDVKNHLYMTKRTRWKQEFGNEDVWFTHNLPNVAPYEVCRKFGVETEFTLGTLCAHAIDKHLTVEQCAEIRAQYLPRISDV